MKKKVYGNKGDLYGKRTEEYGIIKEVYGNKWKPAEFWTKSAESQRTANLVTELDLKKVIEKRRFTEIKGICTEKREKCTELLRKCAEINWKPAEFWAKSTELERQPTC